MNIDRLDHLLEAISDFQLRAEVREFARAPQDEQLIALYLELKALKQPAKSLQERLYEFGVVGAFLGYVLFDQKRIPWLGGD